MSKMKIVCMLDGTPAGMNRYTLLHEQELPLREKEDYQRCPLRLNEEILLDRRDGGTTGFLVERIFHDNDGTIYVEVCQTAIDLDAIGLLRNPNRLVNL